MEHTRRCTICDAAANTHEFGHRYYCDAHFRSFYQDFPLVWQTTIFLFSLMIVLVLMLAAADIALAQPVPTAWRVAMSICVSILPGTIWFGLLYRNAAVQGSAPPGPLPILAVVGILLQAAVVHPLIVNLLQLESWLSATTSLGRLLGLILLEGFPHAFLLYAVVLFIAWRHADFTRRVDGVLFVIAAGLAYSSALGVLYVVDHEALTILNGNLRLLSMQAALLAPSLTLGYFFGQNRFEDMPPYFLSIGVALFAGLNGLMLFVGSELNFTGLGIGQPGFSPWPGLVVDLIILGIVFVIVRGLMQRQNELLAGRLT